MKRSRLRLKSSFLEGASSHSSRDYEYDPIQTLQYPSDSLTTRDDRKLESRDLCPSSAYLSGPNVNTDVMTSCGACSSVPNFEALKVSFHSDPVKLDTSKPQYPSVVSRELGPFTSTSVVIPYLWEQREGENEWPNDSFPAYWDNRQVLPSLETMPGIYATSRLGDDFDGDEVQVHLEGSSLVLSVDEWKYVLVGIHIAMNTE